MYGADHLVLQVQMAPNVRHSSSYHHINPYFTLQISLVVLRHFDASFPTVVETDSSGFAIAAILSQLHPDGYLPCGLLVSPNH